MLVKENELNKILGYKNFYEKHIYNQLNNKRLNGKNRFMYQLAGNIIIDKIDKFIKISRIQEPDFTLIKDLGETLALHKHTNKYKDWNEYNINSIKHYLPNCVVSGDFYRYVDFTPNEILNKIQNKNFDLNELNNAIRSIITIGETACCSYSKSFIDSIVPGDGKLYGGSSTSVPIRLIVTLQDGIDIEKFWNELLKIAYENDINDFSKDFGDCIGGAIAEEKEVIGLLTSNYKIYNLKEIYDLLKGE